MSQDPQAILNAELGKVRLFMESHRTTTKGEESTPCFFRLFFLKSQDANPKGAQSFYVNYKDADMDDSLKNLAHAIAVYGNSGTRFIAVSLVSSKSSNNDHVVMIYNPYYSGALPTSQGVGIVGFGYGPTPAPASPSLYNVQKEALETKGDLMRQIDALKHEQELDRREDIIASLQEAQASKWDKLWERALEIADKPMGKTIGNAIAGFIDRLGQQQPNPYHQQPLPNPYYQQPPPNPYYQPPSPAQQPAPQPQHHVDGVEERQRRLADALSDLEQMYPDTIDQILADLSHFAKHFPHLANQMIQQLKEHTDEE